MNLNIDFENEDVCKKLQKIFLDKILEISENIKSTGNKKEDEKAFQEEYSKYLFKHGIFVMGIKHVYKYCNSKTPHYICIENPEGDLFEKTNWNVDPPTEENELKFLLNRSDGSFRKILTDRIIDDFWYTIPTKLAEKALALGKLP